MSFFDVEVLKQKKGSDTGKKSRGGKNDEIQSFVLEQLKSSRQNVSDASDEIHWLEILNSPGGALADAPVSMAINAVASIVRAAITEKEVKILLLR